MRVLGINAIYHDPAAALVVDGKVVAAAEEERFSRRKHGKRPLPWSAWELPELSAAWCLAEAGIRVSGSQATFYLWFAAPGGDDAAYAEALLRHRVVASPGRAFGPAGQGWLRLALVPSVAGCHAAVASWRAAIADGSLPR